MKDVRRWVLKHGVAQELASGAELSDASEFVLARDFDEHTARLNAQLANLISQLQWLCKEDFVPNNWMRDQVTELIEKVTKS